MDGVVGASGAKKVLEFREGTGFGDASLAVNQFSDGTFSILVCDGGDQVASFQPNSAELGELARVMAIAAEEMAEIEKELVVLEDEDKPVRRSELRPYVARVRA